MRNPWGSNGAWRWVAAFAAGCIWLGLWAVLLAPSARSRVVEPREPRARLYFAGSDVTGRLGAAGTWSPLVFSLPSPAGFSAFAREADQYVDLPLMADFIRPLLFERNPEEAALLAAPPTLVAPTTLPQFAIWRVPSRDLSRERSRPKQQGKTYRPVVTSVEGVDPDAALKMDLPREVDPPRNGRMVLFVCTDAEGIVLHVIPEELDPEHEGLHRIVSSAFTWRFAAEESPVEARVVIDWLPEPGKSGSG